jgi:hypothetical protein
MANKSEATPNASVIVSFLDTQCPTAVATTVLLGVCDHLGRR